MQQPKQSPAGWAALVTLSAGLAALLLWLHAPAALMLGPLAAAIVVASNGARIRPSVTYSAPKIRRCATSAISQ